MGDFSGTERFELLRTVGEGGMGVVYEVFDRTTEARVALKTLKFASSDALYRLKQEFRSLQEIRHPNLIELGELVEESGQWFFTMELVDGQNLMSHVRDDTAELSHQTTVASIGSITSADSAEIAPPPAEAAEKPTPPTACDEERLRDVLRQLTEALIALHDAGKIHRDIKPSNVLVGTDGRVVLLDFGLVAEQADEFGEAGDLGPVGTVAYMAPEQASGARVGPAADWYSVGVLLYQALTGELPHKGHPYQIIASKQQQRPPPPSAHVPTVAKDLDELCASLLSVNPDERPSGTEVLTRLGSTDAPITRESAELLARLPAAEDFVGRRDELDALWKAYKTTRAGNAVTVFIHGESGMGKSTLIRQLARTVRQKERDAIVLWGRSYERESVPYKAIDGAIDGLSRVLRDMPRKRARALLPTNAALLPRLFPVLDRVDAIARAPRPRVAIKDPYALRKQVFAALRELLRRLAEKLPVLLVLDDLQWADGDSLPLLRELLRPPGAPAFLVLASSRRSDPPGQGTEAKLARSPVLLGEVHRLQVGKLTVEAAEELAQRVAADSGTISQAELRAVALEAHGHPLYIDRLMRHAASGIGEPGQRVSLSEAIWAQVEALGGEERQVVDLCCLAGEPIAREILLQASDLERAVFSRVVDTLQFARLVRSAGLRPSDRIEPYHDRVRESVEHNLASRSIREVHQRLGVALETSPAATTQPHLVLRHLEAAGETARAGHFALTAAERAIAALAFGRAAQLFERALDLLEDLKPGERIRIQIAHADALGNAGNVKESTGAYLAVAPAVDPVQALQLRGKAVQQLLRGGYLDEGMPLADELLRDVGLSFPRKRWRQLLSAMIYVAGQRRRARKLLSYTPSEPTPECAARLDALWSFQSALSMVNPMLGIAVQSRFARDAIRFGDHARAARALGTEGVFVSTAGRRATSRARHLVDRAVVMAEESDDPYTLGMAIGMQGWAAVCLQDWRLGGKRLHEGSLILRERCAGYGYEAGAFRVLRIFALLMSGQLKKLKSWVPQLLDEGLEQRDEYLVSASRAWRGNVAWLLYDNPEEARAQALLVSNRLGESDEFHLHHYYQLLSHTQLDLYQQQPAEALARIEQWWRRLLKSMLLRVEMTHIAAWEMRARCLLAAATPDTVHGLTRSALACARQVADRSTWGRAVAEQIRGCCAALLGDNSTAASELSLAERSFTAADMPSYAALTLRRRGQLIGGIDGEKLVAEADAWLQSEGVENPARFCDAFAPPVHKLI